MMRWTPDFWFAKTGMAGIGLSLWRGKTLKAAPRGASYFCRERFKPAAKSQSFLREAIAELSKRLGRAPLRRGWGLRPLTPHVLPA